MIMSDGGVKNILIKVSGDVSSNQLFIDFAIRKAKGNYVVVICGAGTKISDALKKSGYEIKFDDNHGRITETWQERQIVRSILEEEERNIQDIFVGKGIIVEAPIISVGRVLCPINGDNYVKAAYLGFDEVHVLTLKDRVKSKEEIFVDFPKVEIIGV